MTRILHAAAALALLAAPAAAQGEAGGPQTPQTLAREMFAQANDAMANEDYEAARRLLEAALDLKPAHPAILRGLATVGQRAGRPEDVFSALERLATAGVTELQGGGAETFIAGLGRAIGPLVKLYRATLALKPTPPRL